MDSPRRSIAKALSWQGIGLVVTVLLGRLFFGSWQAASAFALTGQAVAVVVYVLHERAWARIDWGRVGPADGAPDQAAPISSPASTRSIRATVSSNP